MAKTVQNRSDPQRRQRSTEPRRPVVIERRPLTPAEAADYLGVTERWIRRAVAERRIPFMRMGPRLLRFHPDDLDRWMESQRVPTAGEA